MEYLHNRCIIHRDIKGANILVDEDGIAKISDFGISKKNEYEMAYKYNSRMSFQGSIFWMAPEVIRGKGYSAKVDIWSLGCVVLEMFTGVHPWKQFDEIQPVMFNLGMMNKPYIPKRLSQESQNLLNMCLDVNPEKRPTAKQLLAHSFCKPPDVPFDFKEYYQHAIEKVNKFDISAISNSVTSVTSNSVTSYDVPTELSNEEEIITEENRDPTTEKEISLDLKEDNVVEEAVVVGDEDEEEEEHINLDNIIPEELKLDTLNEENDQESNDESEVELLPTPRTLHPNSQDERTSPVGEDHPINEDLITPLIATRKEKSNKKVEGKDPLRKRINHIDINNSKSLSNGTSTISSFTFSLSLTNTSFSSFSSPLSSLSSSFETNNSSELNTILTKSSSSKATSSESAHEKPKTGKVTEERREHHAPLFIKTSMDNGNKINNNQSGNNPISYHQSNLSLSKISEESQSQSQSRTSPIVLTPRTPVTPTTPKQIK